MTPRLIDRGEERGDFHYADGRAAQRSPDELPRTIRKVLQGEDGEVRGMEAHGGCRVSWDVESLWPTNFRVDQLPAIAHPAVVMFMRFV